MDERDRSQLEFLRIEMAGKLDLTNSELRALTAEVRKFNEDHERRMRSVEKWKLAIPVSSLLVIAAFLGGRTL